MLRIVFILLSFLFFANNNAAQTTASDPTLTISYTIDGREELYQLNLKDLPDNNIIHHDDFILLSGNAYATHYRLSIKAKRTLTFNNIQLDLPHIDDPRWGVNAASDIRLPQYFCNGFQSWTTSQELNYNDKIKTISPLLKAYSQNLGDYNTYYKYPKKKGILHSWSFTYKRFEQNYAFVGSLNEHTGYTLFIHDANNLHTSIQKDCAGRTLKDNEAFSAFDLVFKQGNQQTVWSTYTGYWGANPSKAKPAIGWTSWYNYYEKIDEKIILDNLQSFAKNNIPLDIFQIDDGYQSQMGDWLTCNEKFPNGMQPIAKAIHQEGYKAGLWLAPFVASKQSKIFKEHPDWFIKDKKGKPQKVAINVIWKGPYYALDIYKPAVRTHLKNVIQTILYDWDYDMIKVDFLFAACLKGTTQHTRGQIMADAMKLLREYAGDKLILGCGVPLAPCFHQVDYCRIGNDAHLGWEYGILKFLGAQERPSTWSTLTNTLMRYQLSHNFFLNDPDVFILRSENTQLSSEEKYTMLLLNNLLGAVIFNSDNIANYDSTQMAIYRSIFPHIVPKDVVIQKVEQQYYIHFNANNRQYLLLCNMGEKTATFSVPTKLYFNAKTNNLLNFSAIDLGSLPVEAHQSKLLYQVDTKQPINLLGGQNHLISGQAIETMDIIDKTHVHIQFKDQAQQKHPVLFYVHDKTITKIWVNDQSCPVHHQIAQYKAP